MIHGKSSNKVKIKLKIIYRSDKVPRVLTYDIELPLIFAFCRGVVGGAEGRELRITLSFLWLSILYNFFETTETATETAAPLRVASSHATTFAVGRTCTSTLVDIGGIIFSYNSASRDICAAFTFIHRLCCTATFCISICNELKEKNKKISKKKQKTISSKMLQQCHP